MIHRERSNFKQIKPLSGRDRGETEKIGPEIMESRPPSATYSYSLLSMEAGGTPGPAIARTRETKTSPEAKP